MSLLKTASRLLPGRQWKSALALSAAMACAGVAYAGPALDGFVEVTQPDGTTLSVQIRGDEFQGWLEAANGSTIVKNPATGFYEYAVKNSSGALAPSGVRVNAGNDAANATRFPSGLRPTANQPMKDYQAKFLQGRINARSQTGAQNAPTPTGTWAPTPVTGPKKSLMILVNFTDAKLSSRAAAYWGTTVFANGGGYKSVNNFYKANSFNNVSISPVPSTQVGNPTGVVTVNLGMAHPNCGGGCSYGVETGWINAALAAAAPYVDFASLDTNADGTISIDEAFIYFVLAGYDTSATSLTPSIWAHAWGADPGDVTVAGKNIVHWALNGEMFDATSRMPMGVVTHETGHIFGLPDLYDTSYTNNGMGAYSIMASGSWGARIGEQAGTTPVSADALSRQFLGWSAPQFPVDGSVVTFNPALSGPTAPAMLMNSASKTNEYWLVENRVPTGWDEGMQRWLGTAWVGGLLVQHIDLNAGTTKDANDFNMFGNATGHQGATVVEPSTAVCSLMHSPWCGGHRTHLYYSGNSTVFSDVSTPNSHYFDASSSLVGISGVSAPGNVMTATVAVGGANQPPAAPAIGVATAGANQISVAFTPGAIGSGTLVNYTASCGGVTQTGGASPIVVTGLTGGVAYTCKVKTTSTVGTSAWSADSNSATPTVAPVLPSAPTIGAATAGNTNAVVTFTPNALGSGTFVSYTADCGGVTQTGASSPITVPGLTNGSSYTCKVKTTSSVGDSPWSANSNSVTPTAVVRTNVALIANGGVASASGSLPGHPASSLNNDELTGGNYLTDKNSWTDDTPGSFPDWVQVNFPSATVDKVVVFSTQDNLYAPVVPGDADTFSLYGVTAFNVQAWNGSAWVTVASVTGNNLVKRSVTFAPVLTTRIRIQITGAASMRSYSYLTEAQAWGIPAP